MSHELSTHGSRSLRRLFEELVWRHFFEDIQLEEPSVARYVTELLADFSDGDNVSCVQTANGQPVQDIGALLLESNPLLSASSFDREREIRKHVGDYALFMTGLFPESVARVKRAPGLGAFIDFVRAGKESYAIVSSFDQFEYRDAAPLFRRLSEHFELCVNCLNMVKQDLQMFQFEA